MGIRVASSALYAIHDDQLQGFITWMEKHTSAVFLFTSGIKAERYIAHVYPNRPLSVYSISKTRASAFVESMLNSGLEYALIDVPPEHADAFESYDDEVVRNYAIVDLRLAFVRMTS